MFKKISLLLKAKNSSASFKLVVEFPYPKLRASSRCGHPCRSEIRLKILLPSTLSFLEYVSFSNLLQNSSLSVSVVQKY